MTFLLDINVLLALADRTHVHHERAHAWFARRGLTSWATCPITENGFIRIVSNPTYPNHAEAVLTAVGLLGNWCGQPGHTFWDDDVSIREFIAPDAVITPRQITDVYLLALAVAHGGKLATLDARIPVRAVPGGAEALEVI